MSESEVIRNEEQGQDMVQQFIERKSVDTTAVVSGEGQEVMTAPPNNDTSNLPGQGGSSCTRPAVGVTNAIQLHDTNVQSHDQVQHVVDVGSDFPLDRLNKLDEQLSRPKWVVPVRPGDDLEILLRSSIKLCVENRDTESELCQRFFRDGLTTSFSRILTDEAVTSWKPDIQRDIYNNSRLLVELCVTKLDQDWFVLLELLAMLFSQNSKWNQHNISHQLEMVIKDDEELFTINTEGKHNRTYGWLLDLINLFGSLGGFRILHNRIVNCGNLSVPVVAALIKPFGCCAEFLSDGVFEKYLIPVVDKVITFLDELSDEALKKEATSEAKSDTFSSIMKSLRYLCHRIPGREDIESFRLKMILRLLQIASFSGKMNALNEINKIVPTMTYHPHCRPQDDDQMMGDKLALWIESNNVLAIVFRDNLHQPQYVEKLDKLVRFCIKEKALSLEDLDRIWASQDGKHEIIVKNIHDMLVKLAWDFSPEQLEYLFGCFQRSWVGSSKKQRDELLDFIRHLAEDDKEGVMATKVLELLWNLAHRNDCPTDTMDHALTAHLKILDYSCSQERESQKLNWLQRCVEELGNDKWVIPALKQMREICLLYVESPMNYVHHHRSNHFYYRNEIISHLDTNYHLLSTICQNLEDYMKKVRQLVERDPSVDPDTLCLDGRFNHHTQISSRLDYVRFALKDGQLWLGHQQALMVWGSLAERAAFASDKEACYKWFAKLVAEEPDIEPETAKKIFLEDVHKIAPQHLTENAFRCFDRFFRVVNINERRLLTYRGGFVTERVDLMGIEYLWKAVLVAPENIVYKPIELLKDVYTNLNSKLQKDQVHTQFIQLCMSRLQFIYDSLKQYQPGEVEHEAPEVQQGHKFEVNKLVRCLSLLKEYVIDCDDTYGQERCMPPHGKSCWGRPFVLVARYISPHSQAPEDFELYTHSNESVATLRRHISQRWKPPSMNSLELSVANEVLRPDDDKRLVSSIPLRDRTVVTVKLLFSNVAQTETNMNSSDNSTDSSEGSPTGTGGGTKASGPNLEQERLLPSCVISSEGHYITFLLMLCDFAVANKLVHLRDSIRSLLKLLPTGTQMLTDVMEQCKASAKADEPFQAFKSYVLTPNSPAKTLYVLELIHSLLMPAVDSREPLSMEFQTYLVQCSGLQLFMGIITDKNFMIQADTALKRSGLLSVLKVLKLLLISSAYASIYQVIMEMKLEGGKVVSEERRYMAKYLQTALDQIIPSTEHKLKNVCMNLAKTYAEKLISPLPDLSVVKALQLLGWAAACGDITQAQYPANIHQHFVKHSGLMKSLEPDDTYLAKETLEVLCLCVMITPQVLEILQNSQDWRHYVTDILILTRNRLIRVSASDQFFYIVTKTNSKMSLLVSFISLLFAAVETVAKEHAQTSGEFFRLLARMLNHAHIHGTSIQGVSKLLEVELMWLLKVREDTLNMQQCPVESALLDGHLSLTVELLAFRSVAERNHIGSHPNGQQLIKKLIFDFLFPASRLVKEARDNPDKVGLLSSHLAVPICSSTDTTLSAFKLLNALCAGCYNNVHTLQDLLTNLFYSGSEPAITEWEFLPHIGPRPHRGFVGLKNAGATCYMNSVLQQLYMIPPIRDKVLKLEVAAEDLVKQNKEDEQREHERLAKASKNVVEESEPLPSPSESGRKDTHKKVLMQIQSIFSHLMDSKLQFHIPRGFWRDFRLWGEKVNLREQHDAFEFFNCLLDSLDEGMKCYGLSIPVSQVLGGSFADQKICEGCPHRYSREEPFTALNMDIRNQQHLFESLDTFVKGDLLEGANAYHCEKCDKKVDTVKRMCIKRLPKILCIQLKRFDYDWEREMAIKFNDYFEFPREFDMAPYTASVLSEVDNQRVPSDSNEVVDDHVNEADLIDNKGEVKQPKLSEPDGSEEGSEGKKVDEEKADSNPGDEPGKGVSTNYRLRGVVVHSGQASGGHYYSFIYLKPPGSVVSKWFKFDDGEVSEAKLDDEEEFKSQCFGGEFTGEVYDHVLKKTHYRRQKKWWSAYLLFYDRHDQENVFEESLQQSGPLPEPIQQTVQRQNLEFHHNKSHFSYSYFQFVKQLLTINFNYIRQQMDQGTSSTLLAELENLGMLCVQLATKFLFHCGFHTKRSLRGPALEWYDVLHPYLNYSLKIRRWFVETVFIQNKHRLCEYLLESPSTEIRAVFSKLVAALCWLTNKDPSFEVEVMTSNGLERTSMLFSERTFRCLLDLLKKEVSEHSRHLIQYFQVFLSYASRGIFEKKQLIKLGVPSYFIAVALDEGPGPPLRSPYTDLTKLYAVVSVLVRCCDVTSRQFSSIQDRQPLPNPYGDSELCIPLPNELEHWLYEKTSTQYGTTFVKKLIEDNCTMDETVRFFAFCSWENVEFSMVIINELLLEITTVQAFDMRPYLDLMMHLMLIPDSYQRQRLSSCLIGFPHHADGMTGIIQHGQTHYQKKAYLCIKFLVQLCSRCELLIQLLSVEDSFKLNWQAALSWLQGEMERRPYVSTSYNYSGWSPPVQSNEASNGYFLERSNSARMTLKNARELFPLPECADDVVEEDQEILPGGDPDAGMPVDQARVHGIERGPHISDTLPTEHLPYSPAKEEGLPANVGTSLDDITNNNNTLTHPDSD